MFKSFVRHVFHIANHFHRFHLKQIRNWPVLRLGLSLKHISPSVLFISGDAFPRHCTVTLAWADSDAELSEWNLRRRSGSSNAFERNP
jgi:hypothetical protein